MSLLKCRYYNFLKVYISVYSLQIPKCTFTMEVYCEQKSTYCNRTDFRNFYRVFALNLSSLSSLCNQVFAIEFLQIEFCELSFFYNQVFAVKFLQIDFFAIEFLQIKFLQLSVCNWVFANEFLQSSFCSWFCIVIEHLGFAHREEMYYNHINLVFHACNMAINYT